MVRVLSTRSIRVALSLALFVGTLASSLASSLVAQSTSPVTSEIVRGRVTGDSGRAGLGATVIVTRIPSAPPYTASNAVSRAVDTDSAGHYEVAFENGSGNYLVYFSAPGYQSVRRRVTRPRTAAYDSVLVLDVSLVLGSAQQLTAVKVTTPRRRKPPLDGSRGAQTGNVTQQVMDPINDTGDGDLATIAASVPGVNIVPSTDARLPAFSVLGLSPSDNVVHLGGLVFNDARLPVTSRVAMALKTTEYDVAVGGFSGGDLELNVFSGSNYSSRDMDVSVDAPALQATDPAGRSLGAEYRDVRMTGSLAGPIVQDKLLYNVGVAASDRSSPPISLGSADASALSRAGISTQAAASTLGALQSLGLPYATSGGQRTTRDGSVLARFDIAPSDNRVLDIIASADVQHEAPSLIAPTATASQAGTATSHTLGLQGEFARYVNTYYLTRLRTGLFLSGDDAVPLTVLPSGVVRVASVLPDSEPGLANVSFGGGSRFPQSSHSLSWQTTYEATWFAPDNAHQPKLTSGFQLDMYANGQTGNRRGTFVFNSLADLEASDPAAFTRVLSGGNWNSNEMSGWLSIGDLWHVGDQSSIQYGLRAEGSRYGTRPAYNPLVDNLFHIRTDALPSDINLSPRIGFTWSYGHQSRVGLYPEPLGTFRGGVGEFESTLPVTLPGAALVGTGLPGAITQIACVGPASPQPDWTAYESSDASIPSACAGGVNTGSSANFADALPHVSTISPGYAPARSWRGNVGWSGDVGNLARISGDAIYSINLDRPSMIDMNLATAPSFFISDEGNRPVFAAASQIDPATGGIAPLATRKYTELSSVSVLTSDMRSESRQLSFTIQPTSGVLASHYWTVGYAYTHVRDEARGFDGASFGDPRAAEWGPAALDIRHSINGSYSLAFANFTRIVFNAQLRSGMPYTPMIAGDVNGDGLSNDRAFVFDPAHAGDSVVAAGMRQLLHTAPSSARDCLLAQLGKAAERNSCRGPWTALTSAQLKFSGAFMRLRKVNFSVTATNLLGGVDALLHGSDDLHGWGQPALPDPTLLEVKGFDPTTRTFSYQVNPTFGETRPFRTIARTPFVLTVTASLPLGAAPYYGQIADELIRPGRQSKGTRLTPDEIATRFAQARFLDPVRLILAVRDSLVLSAAQSRELAAIHARYTAASDSIWHQLGAYLASLPTKYSEADVLDRVRDARLSALDLLGEATRELKATLTPDQLGMLSPDLLQLIDERLVEYRRRAELRSY